MTDTAFIALVSIVPATIAAITAAVVSIRNGKKANAQATKLEEVHSQTNGYLSKVTEELTAANSEIASLKELVHALHKKGNDAQAGP